MFPDLPEHLQALNALPGNTPPTGGMNQEQEEAFWGFLHADELFRNFGTAPSPSEQKHLIEDQYKQHNVSSIPAPPPISAPAPTPVAQTPSSSPNDVKDGKPAAQTLESFIAAYIGQSSSHGGAAASTSHAQLANYLPALPTSSYNPLATPSSAPTPAGLPPSELLPGSASIFGDSPDEARITGAKRLKQLGAGQVEIEEDKRRRNTEASARFRAKKKEREQALERRAKDLEAQLAALQAENSSLENENRLLKAIVLNGAPGTTPTTAGALAAAGSQAQPPSLQAALASLNQKRKRDE
ncbi:hypothetical protein I317_00206 [Kwoniella heveanensis CBS 569]|nr:hypothetical protein I317_00206 [Kwoniella heveanensis CBS 569]